MPFDLIIFDLDGTLVDSEPIANLVLAEHLARIGLPLTVDEVIRTFVGLSLPSVYALAESRFGVTVPDNFTDALQQETFARFREGLLAVPGVDAALQAIPVAKCVASSSAPDKIALSLDLTGLAHHFGGHVFSAVQVPRGKPFPDLFLFAAGRMGALPVRTAVVEDSLPGVQAGVAAGMTVFAFTGAPHADPAALAAAGGLVFTTMTQLPALLAAG